MQKYCFFLIYASFSMIFLHKSFFFRIFAANFTNASKFMKDSREFLEQYGIQYTRERAYVVDYLMSHNTHPTADEIYAGLLTKQIAVSRATVYNSLKTLTACGAVFSLQITEGTIRYDINRHRHAHFRCIRCGKIEDMPMSDLRNFSVPEGYKLLREECYLTGVCACCRGVETTAKC